MYLFFYAYMLQASLHPKFLYSSFIQVSGTFFTLHGQAAKQLTTATWFGTQSLTVSIPVKQANATGTWLLCAPKILAREAMYRGGNIYLDRHPFTAQIH